MEENTQKDATTTPLETVRDILFGEQVRQQQQKHTELEQFIVDRVESLRTDTEKMFSELSQQLAQLSSALSQETQARESADEVLNQYMRQMDSNIEKLDAETKTSLGDLQDQLLNYADLMQEKMQGLQQDMTTTFNQEVDKLSRNKADKSSLASLLSGIASQLTDSEAGA